MQPPLLLPCTGVKLPQLKELFSQWGQPWDMHIEQSINGPDQVGQQRRHHQCRASLAAQQPCLPHACCLPGGADRPRLVLCPPCSGPCCATSRWKSRRPPLKLCMERWAAAAATAASGVGACCCHRLPGRRPDLPSFNRLLAAAHSGAEPWRVQAAVSAGVMERSSRLSLGPTAGVDGSGGAHVQHNLHPPRLVVVRARPACGDRQQHECAGERSHLAQGQRVACCPSAVACVHN